jgi:putative hemolysin
VFSDSLPIAAGICLGGSGLLSLAAYSLRNFSRSRLQQICRDRQQPDRFGEILRDDEEVLLACELLAIGLLAIGLTCLGLLWFDARVAAANPWLFALKALGLALGAVIGVVALPWAFSLAASEGFLYRCWPLLRWVPPAARPALAAADWLHTLFHRIAGRELTDQTEVEAFAEELQSVVDEGEREGVVEIRHGRMIQRLMEIHEVDVVAAMTPRTEIVSVPATATFDDARRVILDSGHSRLPVVGESLDDILGILYARDLLEHVTCHGAPAVTKSLPAEPSLEGSADYLPGVSTSPPPATLADLVRDPLFIPESTSIETLLEQMKSTRIHVAIVLDEYGGLTGLVTLEDLLEEIVGSIEDEFDDESEELVRRVDEQTVEVDGRVHVDDLNEQFHLELPEDDDFDTVGGFVFSELGRIPVTGEQVRWRNLDITVLAADKRRIQKLRIHADPAAVAAADDL